MNFCGKRSDLPLPRKRDRKKEKSVVSFTHEQNIICSETHWTPLPIGRPLFVGSYLRVTWWAFGQWKGKKTGIESLILVISDSCPGSWVKLLYCLKIIVSDLQSDTRLIRTPHDYGQIALSLVKESPYIFSKFNSLNRNTFYGSLSVRVNGVWLTCKNSPARCETFKKLTNFLHWK